jgi:N-acyl-D-aspartate/D-glutamate deacylase
MTDVTETGENLEKIMRHPLMSFGTDSLYSPEIRIPRSYSAAVELLSEYVVKKPVLTIEEAVRKMSGENAKRLGLRDRGTLEKGKVADLVLFDEKELKAEYNDGVKPGIKAVFVNGKCAVKDGAYTAGLFGKVL